MLIVQKFGGSSLANKDRVFNAAKKIIKEHKKGNKVVVVLSAQGNTTDFLIKKAYEFNNKPNIREVNMLITTGEQQSVALMALAIISLGYEAISLNSSQIKILTTDVYKDSKIKKIEVKRINDELDKNKIVIVTGYQGIDSNNDITTLGRGGSDTTAVAIAASLKASVCEIYTDVTGIYTADPRIIKNAKKLKVINYEEMLEFASSGAKILHDRSVEIAKEHNVTLIVRSSFKDDEGTIVREGKNVNNSGIRCIALDKNIGKIDIKGLKSTPKSMFEFYNLLTNNGICVDLITQSQENNNKINISFIVKKDIFEDSIDILKKNKNKNKINFEEIECIDNISKLSIIGNCLNGNPAIMSGIFKGLEEVESKTYAVVASEVKIALLIENNKINKVANKIHDIFLIKES